MKKTILPLIALGALTFGIVSVVRSQPRSQSSNPPSPPPVSPYAHAVAAEGLIEASSENISIGTSLSEVVTEVPVVVGQAVKCGEPLFKLDVRQLQADLAAREADLGVAQTQVKVDSALFDDAKQQISDALAQERPIIELRDAVDQLFTLIETRVLVEQARVRPGQADLPALLRPSDVLVVNETRVI